MIHGINTDGSPLFKMGDHLDSLGHDVAEYQYERRHFWSYWNKNNMRIDGSSLLHSEQYQHSERPNIVAHSNGQLVVQSAIEQGAKFNKVFIFSGAGTSDKFIWPDESVNEVHWFVNVSDLAVWFGSFLPGHPFGKAARRGYAGPHDPKHTNHKYDRDKWFNIDHSFWFDDEWRTKMAFKVHSYL